MKIFLSWAGSESQQLAIIFKEWLGMVVQVSQPWISVDIEKGSPWDDQIHKNLTETKIAILFLTKESIESKYLHYEAGAISNVNEAHVCTFLYGIKKSDVKQPLSRFQATEFDKEDIRKLVLTIFNKVLDSNPMAGSETSILKIFDRMWDELSDSIGKIKPATAINSKIKERPERDILEEILNGVRVLRSESSHRSNSAISQRDVFPPSQLPPDPHVLNILTRALKSGVIPLGDLNDPRNVFLKIKELYPEKNITFIDLLNAIERISSLE